MPFRHMKRFAGLTAEGPLKFVAGAVHDQQDLCPHIGNGLGRAGEDSPLNLAQPVALGVKIGVGRPVHLGDDGALGEPLAEQVKRRRLPSPDLRLRRAGLRLEDRGTEVRMASEMWGWSLSLAEFPFHSNDLRRRIGGDGGPYVEPSLPMTSARLKRRTRGSLRRSSTLRIAQGYMQN